MTKMKKFAKYIYGECKEIVVGKPTYWGFATGSFIGYLFNRNRKLVKRTYKLESEFHNDYSDITDKKLDSLNNLEIKVLSVEKSFKKQAETQGRYSETET